MENAELNTSSSPAPAPVAVSAVVAAGATALAILTSFSGSSTTAGVVTVGLMLSVLWVGVFFDLYTHQQRAPQPRERPSRAPRLSVPHDAFAG